MIRSIFNGFCMALADSVPGVSGGTIAFVLGFYDAFIEALNNIFFGNKEEKIYSLKFLLKLGIGWIVGMILAVLILTKLFETHIYAVSSLFLGFVIFSIPLMIREEYESIKGNYKGMIFLLLGIVIVAVITYFNPTTGTEKVIDFANLSVLHYLYIFFAGMIAISAMVLPGISGSSILLILGLYMPVISSIKEVLHFNFNFLPALIAFGLGIICGIFVTIKLIKLCLEKHRSATIYMIIGLMIGSLYAICMGPTTLSIPKDALSISSFNPLTFICGMAVMFLLEMSKHFLDKKLDDKKANS